MTAAAQIAQTAPVHPLLFLTALCGLPLVAYALWTDFKIQALDLQRKDGSLEGSDSPLDEGPSPLQQQTFTAGLVSLIVIVLELFLFLSARSIRTEFPVESLLIFFGLIFLHNRIQLRLLRALSPASAQAAPDGRAGGDSGIMLPPESRPSLLRTFAWGGGMMGLSVATIGGCGMLAVFAVQLFKLGGHSSRAEVQAGALAFGILGGICCTIAALYKFAPVYIRGLLGSRPLEDTTLQSRIQRIFTQAGVISPAIEVLPNEDTGQSNAFVAGAGGGFFGARLFVTRSILERFTPEEQAAIFLHEAAHLRLGHLRQRMRSTVLMVLGLTLVGGVILVAAHAFFPTWMVNTLQLAVPLLGLIVPMQWSRLQIQRHELEADACAVEPLGADPEALISALERLEKMNSAQFPGLSTGTGTHPATRLRVLLIQKAYRNKLRRLARQASEQTGEDQRKAA